MVAACTFPSTALAKVYVDEAGRRVDIPASPQRIVSLAPSITETLFALGLDREVVGVTMLSTYPEAARSKPRVGTFINISLERVVSLSPDLVIGTADGNRTGTVEQLERVGIPVYIVNPRSCEEIFRMIHEGIRGFFLEGTPPALITKCVRVALSGGMWMDNAFIARVFDAVANRDEKTGKR